MLSVHDSLKDTENLTFEPITTVQELPEDSLNGDECLAAHFRMAGHYPHVRALADHAFRWAAKQVSKNLMVYVLKHGAPVDINALLSSVKVRYNPEAIRLLEKQKGATDPCHTFTNPLHTACFYGQLGVVVSLLDGVRAGKMWKILRFRDHRGETALHKAVVGRGEWRDEERVELVHRLLSLGADPTQRDMHGQTAFVLASIRKHDEILSALKATERKLRSKPTPEESSSEDETMTDDEMSSLKAELSFSDETGRRLSYKAEKVHGRKRSWWRSLLSSEAERRY